MANELDPTVKAAIKDAVEVGIQTDRDEKEKSRKHDLKLSRNAWVPALVTAVIGIATFWAQFGQKDREIDIAQVNKQIDATLTRERNDLEEKLKTRDQSLAESIAEENRKTQEHIEANRNSSSLETARMQGAVSSLGSQINRSNALDTTDAQRAQLFIANNEKLKTKDGDQAVVALWFLAGNNENSKSQKEIVATAALLAAAHNPESTARRGLDALGLEARKIISVISKYSPNLTVKEAAKKYLSSEQKVRMDTYIDVVANHNETPHNLEPTLRKLVEYAQASGKTAVAEFQVYWKKVPKLEVPLRVALTLAGYHENLSEVVTIARTPGDSRSNMARNYLLLDDLRFDATLFPVMFRYTQDIIEQVIANRKRISRFDADYSNQLTWYETNLLGQYTSKSFSTVMHPGELFDLKPLDWRKLSFSQQVFVIQACDLWSREVQFRTTYVCEIAKRTDWGMVWFYISARLSHTDYSRSLETQNEEGKFLSNFIQLIRNGNQDTFGYGVLSDEECAKVRDAGVRLDVPDLGATKRLGQNGATNTSQRRSGTLKNL